MFLWLKRAQGIENGGEVHEFLAECAGYCRNQSDGGQSHEHNTENDPYPNALQGHRDGVPADSYGGGGLAKVVDQYHNVGRFTGGR